MMDMTATVRVDIDDVVLRHGGARRTVRVTSPTHQRYVAEVFDHPEPYTGSDHDAILQGLTERAIGRCTYQLLRETGRIA